MPRDRAAVPVQRAGTVPETSVPARSSGRSGTLGTVPASVPLVPPPHGAPLQGRHGGTLDAGPSAEWHPPTSVPGSSVPARSSGTLAAAEGRTATDGTRYPPAPRPVVRAAVLAALPASTTSDLVKRVSREVWNRKLYLSHAMILAAAFELQAEGKIQIRPGKRRSRRFLPLAPETRR